MSDIKAARRLIMRSQVDLDAIDAMVDNPSVADEVFGFLAQQAVEKALKAHLAMMGIQFPLTHQLHKLVSILEDAGVDVPDSRVLVSLTSFAVQFRYDEMETDDTFDRKAVLKSVWRLVSRVKSLVETGGPPTVGETHAVYRVPKGVQKKPAKHKKNSFTLKKARKSFRDKGFNKRTIAEAVRWARKKKPRKVKR